MAYPCHGKTERFTLRLGQHPDVVLAALIAALSPRRWRKAAVNCVRGRRVGSDVRAAYQARKPWGARAGEKGRGLAAGYTLVGWKR